MAMPNAAGFGSGDAPALPVMPQNNGASFAAPIASAASAIVPQNGNAFVALPAVMDNTNNVAPVGGNVGPIIMRDPGPIGTASTGGSMMQPVMPAQSIIQNPQNGYMPGPQQVQGLDGSTNNVHFGDPISDPFANAVSGSQKTDAAWK